MSLFMIGAGLFILTLAGFLIMLGLWTYTDAKAGTDKPAAWTLIVLLVPNLLGLIIYLLVGRTKMDRGMNRFKKPLIAFAVCFILVSGFMIGGFVNLMAADGTGLPTWGGVSIGKVETYWNREWTVSFKTSGSELTKTVTLSDEDITAFHVTGNCAGGKLYLRISQGETAITLDLSDSFNESVDLSEFHAGKVKLMIYNDEAKNASISVNWRR